MTTVLKAPARKPAHVEPVIAVVLDHQHARFFVDDAAGLRELPLESSARMHGGKFHSAHHGSPGRGEKHFNHVRNEESRRHFKDVEQHLAAFLVSEGAMGLVVGGSHPTVAEFCHQLPPALGKIVIKTANLNPRAVGKPALKELAQAARSLTPTVP